MTNRRNSSTDRGGTRTEADYAAAAQWAETSIPDLADQPKNSGEASREAARTISAGRWAPTPLRTPPWMRLCLGRLRSPYSEFFSQLGSTRATVSVGRWSVVGDR